MKSIVLNEVLYDYVVRHCDPVHRVLPRLAEVTARHARAAMQITPDQGALLNMLVKLVTARRVVEVGCFTGYSAIAMASGLPDGGVLATSDIDPEVTEIAKQFFQEAGLGDRIEHHLQDGTAFLDHLANTWGPGSVDLVFLDADKENLATYFERSLGLLRQGGLLAVDNVLWGGRVVDKTSSDSATPAIRAFNEKVRLDDRVDKVMLATADGIYLLRKR